MNKKLLQTLLAVVCALTLTFALTGCGKEAEDPTTTQNDPSGTGDSEYDVEIDIGDLFG